LDQKSCFAACAATTLKLGSLHGHQERGNSFSQLNCLAWFQQGLGRCRLKR
jgi:hypothetical protein